MRAVALVVFAIALQSRAQADPPPRQRFEQNMMVRFHMHENFGLLRTMERLLVHGKIDEARYLANAIARAPDEPGAAAWAKQTTSVRQHAAALASTTSVNEALRESARLAAACGACHVDSGAQPDFRTPLPAPPDDVTVTARMARHRWATERLWEGMLGNADPPWRAGLEVLAATPLPASELGSERVALAKQLQRLAADPRTGQANLELPARAVAYGELLVTCAACHAKQPSDQASRQTVERR